MNTVNEILSDYGVSKQAVWMDENLYRVRVSMLECFGVNAAKAKLEKMGITLQVEWC